MSRIALPSSTLYTGGIRRPVPLTGLSGEPPYRSNCTFSTVTAAQKQVDALVRELLPAQGQWSEAAYLWLTDHTARLIEFTDGYLEVLPMPTDEHQTMGLLLYELLVAFVRPRGGKVLVAPLRLKIHDGKYREPDIVLVRSARDPRR